MKRKAFLIGLISLAFTLASGFCAYADGDFTQKAAALSSLGIFEEDAKNADGGALITKGALLKATVNIFANVDCEAVQIYNDTASGSEYFSAAYLAYQLGIDLGENGNLNAQDYMSAEEFSKLVITASGYDFLTEKYVSSKYPYTMAAMNLKILDKKYYGNEKMTFNDAADALYNLLFIEAPVTSYSENVISYRVSSDMTVLEYCLGLKYAEGVVISTEYTNVNPDKFLKSENIEINADGKNIILSNARDYYNLLGYNCEVFYREDGGVNKMIFGFASGNDEIFIDGDDIYDIDRENLTFEYTADKDENRFGGVYSLRKEKIPYDADIIYNGQYAPDSDAVLDILCEPDKLNIDNIALVDNDGDGKTDVIIANVYKNFGVKSVNKSNQSFTSTGNDVLAVDENEKFYDIYIDGKRADWSDVAVNMMLAVREGFGAKALVTVEAINSSFLGSFYRLEKDSRKAYAEISVGEATNRGSEYIGSYVGGVDNQLHIERYELDNSLYSNSGEILTGNHMYRIFVDKKGKIGALGTYNYGTNNYASWFMSDFGISTYSTIEFGIGVSVEKESVLKNTLKLEVATIKKVLRTVTLETYFTSKDLKIENIPSGITTKYGSDWKKYGRDALNELFINNLFEIFFDSDGKINRITFPCEEKTEGKLSYFNAPGQSYMFKAGILRSLTSDDFIFEYSKLMCIQVPKAGTDPGIDSLYRIIYFTSNTFIESGIYKINTYTFSKSSYMPEIMVMINDYDGAEVIDRVDNITLGVVERAYRTSTDNGVADAQDVCGMAGVSSLEKAAMLTSIYGETYVTPPASKASDSASYGELNTHYKAPVSALETYADPISSGDIVLYSLPHYNAANSVLRYYTTALKLYDYGTKTIVYDQTGTVNGSTNLVIGKVKNVDEQFFSLSVNGHNDDAEALLDIRYDNGSSQRTYVYTPLRDGSGEVTPGTTADLIEAKINNWDVAVASRKLIVIYKD